MKTRDKYKFGQTSNDRRSTVSLYLQLASGRALKCSPIDFGVPWMGGLRVAAEQKAIFLEGHSRCDGYNKISYHQKVNVEGKGKALDLVPYIPGIGFTYDAYGRFGIIGMLMLEAWEELQDIHMIPSDIFLHWGGLWTHKDPKKLGWDMAHFEERSTEQIEKL